MALPARNHDEPSLASLIERSAELKRALVGFALSPRFELDELTVSHPAVSDKAGGVEVQGRNAAHPGSVTTVSEISRIEGTQSAPWHAGLTAASSRATGGPMR